MAGLLTTCLLGGATGGSDFRVTLSDFLVTSGSFGTVGLAGAGFACTGFYSGTLGKFGLYSLALGWT